MKKLISNVVLMMLILCLSIGTSVKPAKGDLEKNWVQWYEWNGVYSVVGKIMLGEMSPTQACDTIIIPAYNAGKVDSVDLQIIKEEIPEAIDYLIIQGVISGETADNTPTPTAVPTPAVPAYTIEDCDMQKYATTDVNIRTEPSTNATKVGNVPQNEQVHVTGKTSNGWYRIEYSGVTGFSVAKYFADKPIETVVGVTDVTPAPTAEPTPEPTEAPVITEAPVEATAVPTATPESITKTEIIEPLPTEVPVPTATPATVPEPKVTPVPTAVPTGSESNTEVIIEPTEAPLQTEPTAVPVVDPAPVEEENNIVPYVVGGAIGLTLVVGFGVWLIKKRWK